MTAEHNEVDLMIASLEKAKRADEELSETESIRKEAEKLHKELQQQIIELNAQKDKMMEEAEQKAAENWKPPQMKPNRLSANSGPSSKNTDPLRNTS